MQQAAALPRYLHKAASNPENFDHQQQSLQHQISSSTLTTDCGGDQIKPQD